MTVVKHIRCNMTQLLEAHAAAPDDLYDLLGVAQQAAESAVSVSAYDLRLIVGLAAYAVPAAALGPEETGLPQRTPRGSLAAKMARINTASEKEVFLRSEILTTVEWEHSP